MNAIDRIEPGAIPGVVCTNDSSVFARFRETGCAAAIWQRALPREIQTWLDTLDPAQLACGRTVLPCRAVGQTVRHLFDTSGMPEGLERAWLEADIINLAGLFAECMSVKFLRLRLEAVTTNACRKFHIDAITGRLVCTYRGTGTQYGLATDGNDPDPFLTVSTGAPILLRGTLWPSGRTPDLLHRSPPIEGTGETRLLLVLDPMIEAGAPD